MAVVTVLSLLGFGLWAALDLPPLAKSGLGRTVASLAGSAALTLAYVGAVPLGTALGLPGYASIAGACLATLGIALMAYSVFFEIPLCLAARQRSQPPGSTAPSEGLVTSGTYALCRHPGALWMGVFLLGAILSANRSGMVLLGLLWMGLDILLVFMQDRVLFPQRFPDYHRYQQSTPFLIPTPGSIRRAMYSVRKDDVALSTKDLRFDQES